MTGTKQYKIIDLIPALVMIFGMSTVLLGLTLWGHALNIGDIFGQWVFGILAIVGFFMFTIPVWNITGGGL